MKKILIVNNNMQIGGVQKSLVNLLREIHNQYEVTLYLFSAHGKYLKDVPENVRILECHGLFRYLGVSQGQCRGVDKLKRGILALICRLFGRNRVMKILLAGQEMLDEEFDCAIAFLHNGNIRNFYGGVQEFVLERTKAQRKVAFLHCDYSQSGANHIYNDDLLDRFDQFAACSESCREVLFSTIPSRIAEKCMTVRNCHDFEEIRKMADDDPVEYPTDCENVLMVSRLTHEKAVERGIEAVAFARKQGKNVRLHIVGDGPKKAMLMKEANKWGIGEYVHFYGEQENPYRYMINADLFMMTSYHEAAPMVIEEALYLGLMVLTVETRSSREWEKWHDHLLVCNNTQEALNKGLVDALDPVLRIMIYRSLFLHLGSNAQALEQFEELIEGRP